MRVQTKHTYFDLLLKAEIALNNSDYLKIAIFADSPSSAEKVSKDRNYKARIIKSIQSAARIKRDYPEKFFTLHQVEKILNEDSNLLVGVVLEKTFNL